MTTRVADAHPLAMDEAELTLFAQELASAARRETLPRWSDGCDAEDKGDRVYDPVTDADRRAEQAMREIIHQRYPDHGVTGEEGPDEPGSSRYSWSLDPVDGTRSFICRLPTWVTLIALLREGRPLLGLVDAPCLDETYVGLGTDAWMRWNGKSTTIRTSGAMVLSEARLSTTDPFLFAEASRDAFSRLCREVRVVRYGHDGYAYARLAAGSLDLVIECGLKPHDYNALVPLVLGAGGTIGDWRGRQNFADGKIIAAASPQLYEEAVARFEAFA